MEAAAAAAGADVGAGALTVASGVVGLGGAGAAVGGLAGGGVGLEHAARSEPTAIAPADKRRKWRRLIRALSVIQDSLPGSQLYARRPAVYPPR